MDVTFNRSSNNHHHRDRRGHHNHHAPTDYEYEKPTESKQPEAVPDFTQDFPSLQGGASSSTSAGGSTSGQANQSSLAKKLAISSGRNVQSQDWSSKTGNGPKLEEDEFPSLPGSWIMDRSQPKLLSKPQKSYQELTRKKAEGSNSKPKNAANNDKASDFPDLPTSTANLHSFGSSAHRNPSGYSPAWTSQAKNTNSSEKSKPIKIAPAPDFPELGKPSAPLQVPKPNKQKAKKQQNEIKSANIQNRPKSKTNGSAAASLASAADLIFSNKPKTKKENSNVPMNVAGQNADDDDDNRYLKNGVKNEGYEGSTVNPSINLVASLPPKEPPPGFNSSSKSKNTKKTPEGDDFPSLPGAKTKLLSKPQWTSQAKNTNSSEKSKPSKIAPAPDFPEVGNIKVEGSNSKSKSTANNDKDFTKKPSRSSYNYISPPDFNARNSKLMGTISTAFGGAKSLEFNSFKSVSNQFRSGKIGANIYLEECSKLLDDATKFEDFLPEMIALLPNISKQKVLQDLF